MFVVTMLFICISKLGCLSWPGHSWKRDFNLSESFSWLNKGIYCIYLESFCSSVLWDVVCFRTECCSSFFQITVIIRLCFQVLVCLFLYLNVNN